MSRFIDITVTGDLKYLLISGECDNLTVIWEQIYSEYTEISAGSVSSHGLKLAINIEYYTARIKNIYSIVNYLRIRKVDGLIDELKGMGFNFKFDDLPADLNRVLIKTKTDEIHLKNAQTQYSSLQGGEKSTKVEWHRKLAQIGKYNQQHYNPALISVMDFVALEKEFKAYIDVQRSSQIR
jgi:hypothetical protein